MSRSLAEFIIPAREARAFVVPRGAHLRIHLVEDKQVGDCCFFNADDPREVFHVGQTWALNVLLGTGNAKSFRAFLFEAAARERDAHGGRRYGA